jgi:hypothetical protein
MEAAFLSETLKITGWHNPGGYRLSAAVCINTRSNSKVVPVLN